MHAPHCKVWEVMALILAIASISIQVDGSSSRQLSVPHYGSPAPCRGREGQQHAAVRTHLVLPLLALHPHTWLARPPARSHVTT